MFLLLKNERPPETRKVLKEPVWSRDSKNDYLKNEQIECTDYFHAGTNLGNSKVASMIFGWVWSRMGMAFWFLRPYNLQE